MNSMARFNIPSGNLDSLRHQLAKLDRKASKLGLGHITLEVLSSRWEKVYSQDSFSLDPWRMVEFFEVVVAGPQPKVAGWTFIATLEHDEDGTIVRGVPGECSDRELVPFRSATQLCQHCNTVRRRIDTFVLRHDDRVTYRQVGRNCLRDFLGHDSPEDLAKMAEYLVDAAALGGSAEEEGWGGNASDRAMSLEDFVCISAALVRRLGWVPKSKAEEMRKPATAGLIDGCMHDNYKHGTDHDGQHCATPKCGWNRLGGHVHVTPADEQLAGAALAWVREMDPEGLSDYLYNLHVVCMKEAITARRYGIAASLVAAYIRERDRQSERAAAVAGRVNEWLGVVGKQERFEQLTCERVQAIESRFGVSHLHIFRDAQGRCIKWFASACTLEQGKVYTVAGKVKEHGEYRGEKQTIITRASAW